MKKSSKTAAIKPKQSVFKKVDKFFTEKFASLISYFGGLLLFASTQSVPGIGTDGHGSLNFGKAPYYFIAEVSPVFTKLGLFLISLGFAVQFTHGFSREIRIIMIIIFILPFLVNIFW
jgi:hypothetical protein